MDSPPIILHLFMSGSHEKLIYNMCKSNDDFFSKVQRAALSLAKDVPTKRARLEEMFLSPSEYGKQDDDTIKRNRVHDHRFRSSLHVSLQVEAFGDFIDTMNKEEIDDLKCYKVAASLMHKMSGVFASEGDRKDLFLKEIKSLLPEAHAVTVQRVITDATIWEEINGQTHYLANYEFKNELKGCSSDPVHQNNGYFVHLQKHEKNDRAPMLLINVVGCHYFQVFGAVWNGSDVCVDPLCSPVSLLFVPRDPTGGVAKTARVLAAMNSTIRKLRQYYGRSEEERLTFNKGPYWHYKDLPCKKMMEIEWLFEADDSGQKVVVKFVRSHYGEDVHRFLAAKQLAPRLISCEKLLGGWYAVVMEKIEGSRLELTVDEPVKKSLEEAVKTMHEEGYVHGDLRRQNILVVDNTVRILDFDWAGKYPMARYPKELNMSSNCNWHSDVISGGIISGEHDLYQIKQILINQAM